MPYYEFSDIRWLKLSVNNTDLFQLAIHDIPLSDICLKENERFSPVSFLNNKVPDINTGNWNITFLYNSNPSQCLEIFDKYPQNEGYFICVTWGLANIMVLKKCESDNHLFTEFEKVSENREYWDLESGEVKRYEIFKKKNDSIVDLLVLDEPLASLEFKSTFDEYISSINGIIGNCRIYLPEFESYFVQLHNNVVNNLIKNKDFLEIEVIDNMVSLNASLSRVHTQLFSCCNGIITNKCPIQNHSLLGIGIASLALFKYSLFLEHNIIDNSITGLLKSIAKIDVLPSSEKNIDKRILENKAKVNSLRYLNEKKSEEGFPIIPFFSGRDGFKYGKITNISVPIMCLYNASRYSWNLLTITHELTHLFVKATIISIESYENIDFAKRIGKNKVRLPLEEEVKYIDWAWSLYYATKCELTKHKGHNDIENELEEIITHIIDFLYFYDGDIEKYMKFIWHSWLTVPSVEKRIEKYIVRTGAAILSVKMEENREHKIKTTLNDVFLSMQKETQNSIFNKIITDYLDNEEIWAKIFEKIIASIHVIELIRVFLFDEKIAANLGKEPKRKSSSTTSKQPYDFKLGYWSNNDINISNPIFFIKNYCVSDKGKEQDALWFFNKLACLELTSQNEY